jgi:hypothetical protein
MAPRCKAVPSLAASIAGVSLLLSSAAPHVLAQPTSMVKVHVHCEVAEGPRLTNCRVVSPRALDEAKQATLAQMEEHAPSCALRRERVGSGFERDLWISDTLAAWERLATLNFGPDWAERPDASIFKRVYPSGTGGRGGRVVLHCTVTLSGEPGDCAVISEEPRGFGFGDAALKASRYFCWRPQVINGQPVGTGTMDVPMSFPPS